MKDALPHDGPAMEHSGPLGRRGVPIGVTFALCVGLLDVLLGMLRRASGLSSLAFIPPPLAATVAAAFLGYLAVWAVVRLIAWAVGKDPRPLLTALAVFTTTLVGLGALNDLFPKAVAPASLSLGTYLMRVAVVVGFSCLGLAAGYFASVALAGKKLGRYVAVLCAALPVLLAETAAFVWLEIYRIEHFTSHKSLVAIAAYAAVAVFTLLVFLVTARWRWHGWLLGALLVAVVAAPFVQAVAAAKPPPAPPERAAAAPGIRHVLFILIDTLRPDALSCNGSQSVATPTLDAFAADSVVFRNALTPAPWTLPAMASVMTGVSPLAHLANKGAARLPDEFKTLAEYLQEAGYYTGAIGDNPNLRPRANLTQGFLDYVWYPRPEQGRSTVGAALLQILWPCRFRDEVTTTQLTESATDWLKQKSQIPSFLWLHYLDPHTPYSPPPAFMPKGGPPGALGRAVTLEDIQRIRVGYAGKTEAERNGVRALYDGEVRYIDSEMGKLFDALKQTGLYDEALIVIASDHGEEFWEHGGFEHGHTLYNELLRPVLMVKLPREAVKGPCNQTVSLESITPTILDLCRIQYDAPTILAGSLAALLKAEPAPYVAQPVVGAAPLYYEDRECITFDGFKYIRSLVSNREELYDLVRDPKEQNSVATTEPQRVQNLRDLLEGHRRAAQELRAKLGLPADSSQQEQKLDPGTAESLRSIGYLGGG